MTRIVFVDADGARRVVSAPVGISVMEAATRNNIPGIAADCGGACACATCHVFVDDAWRGRAGQAGAFESMMLEGVAGAAAGSRLSCQIEIDARLDGLVIHMPNGRC